MSLQLVDRSEWRLVAYGGFFRAENIIIIEARSILYAVRDAESRHPLGRLSILSDNLALVPALCTGRSNKFTLLSVMRRIFASGFRARFVLSFRSIPSELNYSDKGRRFFDRDHDLSKSSLHVLAQRLTRSSPTQTCDRDCLSPSLMHLDDDDNDADLASHIFVPAVSVQSHVPSDVLCYCTGHATVVSSQRCSACGRNDGTGDLGNQICRFSLVPLAWCGGRQLGVVQKLDTHRVS